MSVWPVWKVAAQITAIGVDKACRAVEDKVRKVLKAPPRKPREDTGK